jgi:predicted metal-dependent RNase
MNDAEEFFRYPSIVLASSGMMVEGTNSFTLARHWLHKKDSAIFTVGYMDENTPGYTISNARRGDKIQLNGNDKKIEVNCYIKNFRFSAHSKREELMSIVKKLNPQNIILVHGHNSAIDWVGSSIIKAKHDKKVYAPQNSKEIIFD